MPSNNVRPAHLLLLAALSLALACGGDALGPNGEKIVKVVDSEFQPGTKTITAGETVMWQWDGSLQHNVTWVDQSGPTASATQSSGTYTRNFSNTGTFDYYCTIHGTPTGGMHGSVVVQ